MINDYIHMYSILPALVSPPLLFSEPKPRLPQLGAPKTHPTAHCCHPSPLKGPANTQLPFRQLLPSSPSVEERGLRGGEGRVRVYISILFSLYRGVLYLFSSAHVTMCTYSFTCRNTGHPYRYIHIHIYTHTYTYT